MTRRTPRQQVFDERALPVRVRLLVPEGGIKNLPQIYAWLRERAPASATPCGGNSKEQEWGKR